MVKLLKKAVKWYLRQSAQSYAWTPSCMIPYVRPDSERLKITQKQ